MLWPATLGQCSGVAGPVVPASSVVGFYSPVLIGGSLPVSISAVGCDEAVRWLLQSAQECAEVRDLIQECLASRLPGRPLQQAQPVLVAMWPLLLQWFFIASGDQLPRAAGEQSRPPLEEQRSAS